jgi:hypothetical protein
LQGSQQRQVGSTWIVGWTGYAVYPTPLGVRSQMYVANTRKTYPPPKSLHGDASTLRLQEDHTTQRGNIRRGQCHARFQALRLHSSEGKLYFLAELERCLPSCLRLWQAFIKTSRTIIYNRSIILTFLQRRNQIPATIRRF